jgi:hypothetical protein
MILPSFQLVEGLRKGSPGSFIVGFGRPAVSRIERLFFPLVIDQLVAPDNPLPVGEQFGQDAFFQSVF